MYAIIAVMFGMVYSRYIFHILRPKRGGYANLRLQSLAHAASGSVRRGLSNEAARDQLNGKRDIEVVGAVSSSWRCGRPIRIPRWTLPCHCVSRIWRRIRCLKT